MFDNIKNLAAEMSTYHPQFYRDAADMLIRKRVAPKRKIQARTWAEAKDLDARFLAEVARLTEQLEQMSLLPTKRQEWRAATEYMKVFNEAAQWISNREIRERVLEWYYEWIATYEVALK